MNNTYTVNFWICGAALSFKSFPSFYCDYFHQTSGTRYALRGGISADGIYIGAFYFGLYASNTNASWHYNAALSFKLFLFIVIILIKMQLQVMLDVVEVQVIIQVVEHFIIL